MQPPMQPPIQPSMQPPMQPSMQPPMQPPMQPSIQPSVEPSMQPSMQPPIQKEVSSIKMPSWTSWIIWFFILLVFIVFVLYYSIKYRQNESSYIIKKNAKKFKITLDELKEDIKIFLRRWVEWVRSWNDNIYDKSSQFFFRQHIENGGFKSSIV
jgi:predicted PurR-regulated permease PerM